ncbi:MAG TPA: hypothetical protein ENJ70_02325 [Thermoplasmatales archaeon]|nr:hypothetical protein [Thermoplasmatales archaeon]
MKIEIKIEGEDFAEIIQGIRELMEKNKEEMKEILKFLAKEAIEALEDVTILDKGAELYIKINRAINYKYKKGKK